MLYASLRDGSVRSYDLRADPPAHAEDLRVLRTEITALSLATDGHRADLPLPRRFRSVAFSAEVVRDRDGEVVAERVAAFCDGVHLSLTMHLNGRTGRFRVDLDRKGVRRYIPRS